MKSATQYAALVLLSTVLLSAPVSGDDVRPGDIDAAVVVERVEGMPARGTSKEQTLARLGEPERRLAAVGDPPITRWVYPEFTVYFEHDHVIHAVKRR